MNGPFARKLTLSLLLLAITTPVLNAQTTPAPVQAATTHEHGDIAGDWQGTVDMGRSMRTVLRITKTPNPGWAAKMFLFVEQGAQPLNVNSITLDGSNLKFTIDVMGASYLGTLSTDGNSIVGTLTGGPKPQPLTLVRATRETAWEIPAPPPPPKLMAADVDPAFDVATIKPSNSDAHQLQQLTLNGRDFRIRNGSLGDLIAFAYNVQIKQIVNAPDWLEKDRYDIDAVPDHEGTPNPQQLRVMIQKLLADRFALKFHHDKKELSAYVLTVSKTGQKLTPTQLNGPLPGLGFRPGPGGLTLNVRNGTLSDFTGFLQTLVLDRPVVDQSGLTQRFDFTVKFTPDDSQFSGHPPKAPAGTDATAVEPFPSLFEALQQQLGLKLAAEKTPVDVIAIDHVDKPSAN